MVVIWLFFFILTSLAAYGSFSMWPVLLIAGIGATNNLLWAYVTNITEDKSILLRYAIYWDVAYVVLFAIIPVLFLGVASTVNFWIGLMLILLGICIIAY